MSESFEREISERSYPSLEEQLACEGHEREPIGSSWLRSQSGFSSGVGGESDECHNILLAYR